MMAMSASVAGLSNPLERHHFLLASQLKRPACSTAGRFFIVRTTRYCRLAPVNHLVIAPVHKELAF